MYRVLEIILASLLLILTLPIMVVVALLIFATMGRPILFKQSRIGLHAHLFYIYKFRTMRVTNKADIETVGDNSRVTRLGEWLRKLSIDEFPQLFNIIKGDISFVGPRPLLPDCLKIYTPEQARRHLVKPGLTGLAQINGRNSLPWRKKLKYDVWYVDNRSIWLDLRIIWLTIFVVLSGKDIEYQEHTTGFSK